MSFSTLFTIAELSHSFVSQFSKYQYKQTKKNLKQIFFKKNLTKTYGHENVRSRKCLSGKMFSRGSLLQGSVQSGNCPFGEMPIGEVSVRDLSSGKCR